MCFCHLSHFFLGAVFRSVSHLPLISFECYFHILRLFFFLSASNAYLMLSQLIPQIINIRTNLPMNFHIQPYYLHCLNWKLSEAMSIWGAINVTFVCSKRFSSHDYMTSSVISCRLLFGVAMSPPPINKSHGFPPRWYRLRQLCLSQCSSSCHLSNVK